MDGNDGKWLAEGGDRVDEANEEDADGHDERTTTKMTRTTTMMKEARPGRVGRPVEDG